MSCHIEIESEINTSALGDVHAVWKVPGVEISVKMDNPAQDIRERVISAAERFSNETRRILEGEPKPQADIPAVFGEIPADLSAFPELDPGRAGV